MRGKALGLLAAGAKARERLRAGCAAFGCAGAGNIGAASYGGGVEPVKSVWLVLAACLLLSGCGTILYCGPGAGNAAARDMIHGFCSG